MKLNTIFLIIIFGLISIAACDPEVDTGTKSQTTNPKPVKPPEVILRIAEGTTEIKDSKYLRAQYTKVDIPNTVTTIGKWAFQEMKNLTHIVIPDSVTKIGAAAFGMTGLTSVKLSESLQVIEDYSFSKSKLQSVTIPDAVRNIKYKAFADNNITALTLGKSVKTIGGYAFVSNKIQELTIPDAVEVIGSTAFSNNGITSLKLGKSVKVIEGYAFANHKIEKDLEIPNAVERIGEKAFASGLRHPDGKGIPYVSTGNKISITKNLKLGNSIEVIQKEAFNNSGIIGTVTIPSTLHAIKYRTFYNNGITHVVLHNNITEIGMSAFSRNKITSVTFPPSMKTDRIGDHAFYDNKLTELIIPSYIKTIVNAAFYKNEIATLTIKEGVASIGAFAFALNKLTDITIPNSVTSMGRGAFQNNTRLRSVQLPQNLARIPEQAFSNNDIDSLTIPNSVKTIGRAAFSGHKLEKVVIPTNVESIGSEAFEPGNDNNHDPITVTLSEKLYNKLKKDGMLHSVFVGNLTPPSRISWKGGRTIKYKDHAGKELN